MTELNKDIKDVKEFAEIIKNIKGTGKEYKDFVAGAIAGVRMAHSMEKKAGGGKRMGEENKEEEEKRIKRMEDCLVQILFELRWIQKNMNPPVNYFLIMIVSIITSVIVTIILTH